MQTNRTLNGNHKKIQYIAITICIAVILLASANSVNHYNAYQEQLRINKNLQNSLDTQAGVITSLNAKIDLLENEYDKLEELNIQILSRNIRLNLTNPTRDDLIRFLRNDSTNEHEYVDDVYECMQFSGDLYYSFMRNGSYNMSFLVFNYNTPTRGYGHAVNGIFLDDGTYVVINPYQDQIFDGSSIPWEKTGNPGLKTLEYLYLSL